MLAAASIKHDIRSPTAADNKPGNLSSIPGGSMLMQPNVEFASHSHTSSYQSSTNKEINLNWLTPGVYVINGVDFSKKVVIQ